MYKRDCVQTYYHLKIFIQHKWKRKFIRLDIIDTEDVTDDVTLTIGAL